MTPCGVLLAAAKFREGWDVNGATRRDQESLEGREQRAGPGPERLAKIR
jgi:hypothetical protein